MAAEVVSVVLTVVDFDPDGTQYHFHKVRVPTEYWRDRDYRAAFKFAVETEQFSTIGDECDIQSEPEFLRLYSKDWNDFDRSYWHENGYWSYREYSGAASHLR